MIAVIFEAEPHAEQQQAYLNAAALLRPQLENLPGFISIERFVSLTTPGQRRRYQPLTEGIFAMDRLR